MIITFRKNIQRDCNYKLTNELQLFSRMIFLLVLVSLTIGSLKAQTTADTKQTSNKKNSSDKKNSTDRKEIFDNAEFFFDSEDYQESVFYYQKLFEASPKNGNLAYHIGFCYLNIPGQEIKSIPYFEKAVPFITQKFTPTTFKSTLEQTRAPLHTYYFLGQAYRMNNQMDKALDVLDKFSSSVYFEGNYNESMVSTEIEACKKAKIIMERPIEIEMSNIGPAINNQNENYNPVLTPDTSVIIYMNNLKFYNAIFMSRRENGKWTEADNITPQLGSDGECYPTSISADGKTLYLVRTLKKHSDICVSHFENGKWNIMQPLDENINSKWNEISAAITQDGKRLYFSSDRKGGEGGFDIWYSDLQSNGKWGKAINMGPNVNTKVDEDSPFPNADGTVLFFSSQGHENMGGFDIFYSNKNGNQWAKAINIGYPINTTLDDKFYFPVGNGTTGYMARRIQGGFGQRDIYRVKITAGDPLKDLLK